MDALTNLKPTWNPDCEPVIVTEALIRCQSLVWSLPAGGNPVATHRLNHHDAQGEACLYRCFVVMYRLALVGGVFGSEPFLLVFLKAAKLILSNVPRILSWVAGWVLVAEVGVLKTGINAPHLFQKGD